MKKMLFTFPLPFGFEPRCEPPFFARKRESAGGVPADRPLIFATVLPDETAKYANYVKKYLHYL